MSDKNLFMLYGYKIRLSRRIKCIMTEHDALRRELTVANQALEKLHARVEKETISEYKALTVIGSRHAQKKR